MSYQIPEGWKLVPIEPTSHMERAVYAGDGSLFDFHAVYRAMLAAAPEPPPTPVDPVIEEAALLIDVFALVIGGIAGPDRKEVEGNVKALARRLRAEAPGWQPIETAPKDGRLVDLWFLDDGADGRSTDCYFKDGHWCWEGQRIVYLPSGRPATPTHWMPIPKPPPSWDASLFEKSSVIRAPQRGGR